jgi:hypothetical protein
MVRLADGRLSDAQSMHAEIHPRSSFVQIEITETSTVFYFIRGNVSSSLCT